ncbi:MAG: hypothetical protein U0T82_07440 [Bacteroidales bacterium]
MQKRLSVVISWVFHPVIFPLLTSCILFISGTSLQYFNPAWRNKVLLLIALGTFLLPVSFIPVIYYRRLFNKHAAESGNERFMLLFFTTLAYYLTFHFTRSLPLPALLQAVLLGAAITVFSLLVTSIFFRISLHTAGAGGLTGILLALSLRTGIDLYIALLGAILLAGLVGFARLSLQAHKPVEIYSGFLAGFTVNFAVMMLYP